MTKLILALLTLPTIGFALNSRRIVATGAAPIPGSYSASNSQSLVLSELPIVDKSLLLLATMNGVACDPNAGSAHKAPTAPNGSVPDGVGLEKEIYLIASEPYVLNQARHSKNVYCRCFSGGCSAGELYVHTY